MYHAPMPAAVVASFTALEFADVVWAPTRDGGYCLVGLRRPIDHCHRRDHEYRDCAHARRDRQARPWGSRSAYSETSDIDQAERPRADPGRALQRGGWCYRTACAFSRPPGDLRRLVGDDRRNCSRDCRPLARRLRPAAAALPLLLPLRSGDRLPETSRALRRPRGRCRRGCTAHSHHLHRSGSGDGPPGFHSAGVLGDVIGRRPSWVRRVRKRPARLRACSSNSGSGSLDADLGVVDQPRLSARTAGTFVACRSLSCRDDGASISGRSSVARLRRGGDAIELVRADAAGLQQELRWVSRSFSSKRRTQLALRPSRPARPASGRTAPAMRARIVVDDVADVGLVDAEATEGAPVATMIVRRPGFMYCSCSLLRSAAAIRPW